MSTHNAGCGHCAKAATLVCPGCHNIKYCETRCQKRDWENHKHLCSKFKDFQDPPSPLHRRAILLGEGQDSNPEFVWVEVKNQYMGDQDSIKEEDRFEYFVEEAGVYTEDLKEECHEIRFNGLFDLSAYNNPAVCFQRIVIGKFGGGQLLDHGIQMWYRDDFLNDGSAFNICLEKLHPGINQGQWRGPLLFLGTSKFMESSRIVDLDTADLTIAVEGLAEF